MGFGVSLCIKIKTKVNGSGQECPLYTGSASAFRNPGCDNHHTATCR
jgi:hypothetical protein